MKIIISIIVISFLFIGGTLKRDTPLKPKLVNKSVVITRLIFDTKIRQPPKELVFELKKLNNNIKHIEVHLVEVKNLTSSPIVINEDIIEVKKDTIAIKLKKKRNIIQKILNKNVNK